MNSLSTMLKKEILEIYRSKKFLILVIVFAFVAISSPILAKLIPSILKSMPSTSGIIINIPDATWKDSVDQLVKNLTQFGMIVILLMFSGVIAEEKNKKTMELVLTKPISRVSFVLSKFFASTFYIKLIFISSAIVFYLYTLNLFGSLNLINFIWLSVFLLIFLILILAVTIFFSTISKNQVTAAGMSLLVSIVFTTLIGLIRQIADYSPTYIVSYYKDLMTDGKIIDFLPSALTSIGLIVALILSSIIIFRRQEIER